MEEKWARADQKISNEGDQEYRVVAFFNAASNAFDPKGNEKQIR